MGYTIFKVLGLVHRACKPRLSGRAMFDRILILE